VEVALHLGALGDGATDRPEVIDQKRGPEVIVGVGNAIFGDIDGEAGFREAAQGAVHPLGINLPTQV